MKKTFSSTHHGGLNELGDAFERQVVSKLLFEETGKIGSVIAKGAAGFEEAAKAVSAFGLVLRRGKLKQWRH